MGLGTDLRKGDLTPRPGGIGLEVVGKSIGAALGKGDIPVGKPGPGLNTGLNPSFGSAKLMLPYIGAIAVLSEIIMGVLNLGP